MSSPICSTALNAAMRRGWPRDCRGGCCLCGRGVFCAVVCGWSFHAVLGGMAVLAVWSPFEEDQVMVRIPLPLWRAMKCAEWSLGKSWGSYDRTMPPSIPRRTFEANAPELVITYVKAVENVRLQSGVALFSSIRLSSRFDKRPRAKPAVAATRAVTTFVIKSSTSPGYGTTQKSERAA